MKSFTYKTPSLTSVECDLEGFLCASQPINVAFALEVEELDNIGEETLAI